MIVLPLTNIPRSLLSTTILSFTLLWITSVVGFAATNKMQTVQWEQYITSHTSGAISRSDSIRIRFVNDVATNKQIGKSAGPIFKFIPTLLGSTKFTSKREIVFTPNKKLSPNSKFSAILNSKMVSGLGSASSNFSFSFQVILQDFEIEVSGLSSTANSNELELKGAIYTADAEQGDRIEKMLIANFVRGRMKIKWQHNDNGRKHTFIISNINKQKTTSFLILKWTAIAIGIKRNGIKKIEIPALGEFKVTQVKAINADRQYVEVEFSEKVNTSQNLTGLIRFNNSRFTSRIEKNVIKLYPSSVVLGDSQIAIEPGIQNVNGIKISKRSNYSVKFSSIKPQVRFISQGVILPTNKVLSIPFEAVNVTEVQVTAMKVFNNNIGQFMQYNNLGGVSGINRLGRYLWRKTIPLESVKKDKWNQYSLDATELLKFNPGGMFYLSLSINRGNSSYSCKNNNDELIIKEAVIQNYSEFNPKQNRNYSSLNWQDRNDPCKDSYYYYGTGASVTQNFYASDIGIIAKRSKDNSLSVITTDIGSSMPKSNVKITLYNYQDQVMKEFVTDKSGMANIKLTEFPFYLIAKSKKQKGYLKLSKNLALATSHFNVGGVNVDNGVKGFIYGERGVWRPGDNIYLTFVLQDKDNSIPKNHPVTMRLYSPKGQLVQTLTNNKPVGDFYTFKLKTDESSITGNWLAKAQLGGSVFSKKLKIETVVPNRLKIELGFDGELLTKTNEPLDVKLFSQWLHGAKAANLKYDVKVNLRKKKTKFKAFENYTFDDPSRNFNFYPQVFAEGKLDKEGKATLNKSLPINGDSPGMLSAKFTTRVFEPGGAFSSDSFAIDYSPYENYVGIKLPKNVTRGNWLDADVKHKVRIASVSSSGDKVALDKIQVTMYKINWRWWWDRSGDSLANYSSGYYTNHIEQSTIASNKNGEGVWEFTVHKPEWGRYLIRACDVSGNHCSGKTVYITWPGWSSGDNGGNGATTLSVTTDKQKYKVGDTATIRLPKASQGRALLSIENGSEILQQRWLKISKRSTKFKIPITADMAPNVYVHVSLIQPHKNKKNDRPIRLYGVIPLMVDDPKTSLAPKIVAADEWQPKTKVSVTVAEENGKAMTYTIAVVDEGLLGLTRYKTPDLHKQFYRKEAHGVLTWDMFDYVVGAYGGELERLLAIGGDTEAEQKDENKDKKRFPPVVKFLGPFQLAAGKTTTHQLVLPQYIGAVRVMLVAGNNSAYGKTSKSVFVREPLSILATVPRVIGPDEEMTLPVALFAMDESIKDVKLSIKTDEHFDVVGDSEVNLHFDTIGDQLGVLKLKVKSTIGKGHIRFIASSGKFTTETEVYLDIRSPNPETTRQVREAIEPGASWITTVVPHGLLNTNKVTLEMSSLPPINLENRLRYLIRYPHGCIEQTTSSIFPQLYLSSLVKLEPWRKQEIDQNVDAAIKRLQLFQTTSGGFAYWPGQTEPSSWGSNYAGHFLLEAKNQGYHVPTALLPNWLRYQANTANSWEAHYSHPQLEQAYRLYTLALANKPEMGAMNRLRESGQLAIVARWQLASAYQLAGQADAANELVADTNRDIIEYKNEGYTFGSQLRDQSIILNSLVDLGRKADAKELADIIAKGLSSTNWYSTQSVAYSLLAISHFVGNDSLDDEFRFSVERNKTEQFSSKSPIHQQTFKNYNIKGETIIVTNNSSKVLYANVSVVGVPKQGNEQAVSKGLELTVEYEDTHGNSIDVEQVEQGTDIVVKLSVTNKTVINLTNIALTHIIPSGWQIHNQRFNNDEADVKKKKVNYDYYNVKSEIDFQDIRDDRVLTYFPLQAGETMEFKVLANASYLGHFYLPGISVEPMYDASKHARTKGLWVDVTKPE